MWVSRVFVGVPREQETAADDDALAFQEAVPRLGGRVVGYDLVNVAGRWQAVVSYTLPAGAFISTAAGKSAYIGGV